MYVKEASVLKIKPKPPLFKTSYNYKYNGKELQEELGLNMYDYGARNYDPAIGRWMNIDPLAEKFNFISPYAYVNNDPLGFSDFDGKDFIIDILRDKNGDISGLKISGTVYIQGSGASQDRADELNTFADENLKSKTVDGVTISVDINYKYDKNKKAKDLKSGENLLNFSSSPENADNISHVNAGAITNKDGRRITLAGNTGTIYNSGKNNNTIFHESLHFMGLSDRYDDYRNATFVPTDMRTTRPHNGFETNVMGDSRHTTLNSFQYSMWLKHALTRSKVNNVDIKRLNCVMPVDRKGDYTTVPGGGTVLPVKY
jgi:RHS repeat-associated protein